MVGPDRAGDEPFLMAQRLRSVPVLVGRKRIFPVQAAFTLFGCNVAVLDDGFQHHDLKRDLDIVMLTGREDRMFPAGHLREPISALRRADVVVRTGQDADVPDAVAAYLRDIPIFRCRTIPLSVETGGDVPRTNPPTVYANEEVVLASGIANPARFRNTAQALGWKLLDHRCFPDHHRFTDDELAGNIERDFLAFPSCSPKKTGQNCPIGSRSLITSRCFAYARQSMMMTRFVVWCGTSCHCHVVSGLAAYRTEAANAAGVASRGSVLALHQ